MELFSVIPQPLGILNSPTFVGLTITGNSVFGLNSSVFQPTTDSTTFLQVLDAAGAVVGNFDTTNIRFGIGIAAPSVTLDVVGQIRAITTNITGLSTSRDTAYTRYIAIGTNGANSFITAGSSSTNNVDLIFRTANSGAETEWVRILSSGNVGIGESAPETLTEWTSTVPYLTLHNSTHEDTDGGRESRLNFKGEQGVDPFEETTLARIEVSHDGPGADDKGKIVDSVNTGAGLVEVLRRDSSLAVTTVKNKITPIGGIAVKLTNKTGANSIAGYCVTNSNTTADAVRLVPIDEPNPIGVFLDSGISDGSEAWVVVSGIADVYFWGSTTLGDMARTGLTADTGEVAGQATSEASPTSPFAVDKHFCEVGHVLESRIGAGLARCVLHFN